MKDYSEVELPKIQERFQIFAERECKETSPLYYKLCMDISKDDDMARLASFSKMGQPWTNLFLASVHYLLLKNPTEELAQYYPTISDKPSSEIPFDLFKAFCNAHYEEIKSILGTHIVQTNVIGRCSYLAPIFSELISIQNKPTTIIDIGTSAGLTLNFDHYRYIYNSNNEYGSGDVIVKSEVIDSDVKPVLDISQPLTKIGIDQNIMDPKNAENKLWLKALVWADQVERFKQMDAALEDKGLNDITLVEGSTIDDFKKLINK